MRYVSALLVSAVLLGWTAGCQFLQDHPDASPVRPVASGLKGPLGLEADDQGRLWVTEAGSGTTTDGQLTLITPDGAVHAVVTGFSSQVSPEGAVFGLNHVLLQGNTLWLLHGVEGRLYRFDITSFQPGDTPRKARELTYEDIGSFVKAHPFEDDTKASDVFNLTLGPEGDLFIVDAGANAIIRRKASTGQFSVFATIPPIVHPGGDTLEAVPTGIAFEGQNFLVSNFTGYPYPSGQAPIFQFSLDGSESTFQTGLTTLTDIELGADEQPLVLEYGQWNG